MIGSLPNRYYARRAYKSTSANILPVEPTLHSSLDSRLPGFLLVPSTDDLQYICLALEALFAHAEERVSASMEGTYKVFEIHLADVFDVANDLKASAQNPVVPFPDAALRFVSSFPHRLVLNKSDGPYSLSPARDRTSFPSPSSRTTSRTPDRATRSHLPLFDGRQRVSPTIQSANPADFDPSQHN